MVVRNYTNAMSRVTRAASGKKKDVRAQESHSQEQIGPNVMTDTNADDDALIDEEVDNAEAISTGGASTTPRRNEEEEEGNISGDSDPTRARQGNLDVLLLVVMVLEPKRKGCQPWRNL